MNVADIETQLRELLLEVLGYDDIAEIPPTASLVEDLDAESLDFVETLWVIEENFGVVLKAGEILAGDIDTNGVDLFVNDSLTAAGAEMLAARFPHRADRIQTGLTKTALFRMVTVRDFAIVIAAKMRPAAVRPQGS